MKKIISLLLSLGMLTAALPNTVMAENDVDNPAKMSSDDYAETAYENLYETDADYQVFDIDVLDASANIYYKALESSHLEMEIIDDDTKESVSKISLEVPSSDNGMATVSLETLPEFYSIEAVLANEDTYLSDTYVFYENTHDYQEFMSIDMNNEEFADNVIIDYGANETGEENFAVISNDVKVVYVDSIDDVEIENDYLQEDEVALFSYDADADTSYTITEAENEEIFSEISDGDKVVILPRDNVMQTRILVVGETDLVSLFDGEEVLTVTSDANSDTTSDEFFDFARINIEEEKSNPDMDYSDMDEELELIEDNGDSATVMWEQNEEEAELFASKSGSTTQKSGKFTIKDTFTVTVTFTYSFQTKYKVIPTSASATARVDATNNLKITASGSASIDKSWRIGTVSIYGVSVPIKLYGSLSAEAKLDADATQKANAYVTATWSGGRNATINKGSSGSTTYDFEIAGKLTAKIGIGAELNIAVFKANVQAGVKLTGTVTLLKSTDEYTHECDFCMLVDADVYASGAVKLTVFGKVLIDKSPSWTKDITTFHVSKRGSKWAFGNGKCDYYSYKLTFKVLDKNSKAIKGAAIYKGSTKLGTTNSSGKYSKKILRGTYTFKVKKDKYNTISRNYTVNGAATITVKMSKSSGANETYYTIDDLISTTEDEYNDFMSDNEVVANTIFQIQTKEDIIKLSNFVNTSGRNTNGLRFVLNNSTGTLDLSDVSWTPIGTEVNPFGGELDGNHFIINGLNIDNTAAGTGLFGYTNNASIYDLGLENVNIKGTTNTGAFIGSADNQTTVSDCYVTGVVEGTDNVGGMIGALNESSVVNSYSTANLVGSTNVGGIAGSMAQTTQNGEISNCYNSGEVTANHTIGGIVGAMTYAESTADAEQTVDEETTDSETDLIITGIRYCYYIDSIADKAVGSNEAGNTIIAYPVTVAQATGENTVEYITDDTDSYGFATSLADALNAWCIAFGNDSGEQSEDTGEADSSEIQMGNTHNQWYADVSKSNNGYPIFSAKAPVYPLTVKYVYEDGSEAMPSVTLYLEEGQKYDVDSYQISGYHTGEIEYSGIMTAEETEFRVIYVKDEVFNSTTSELLSAAKDAVNGEKYSINNAEDLMALANYVNAGGNTDGVTFIQTAAIDMQNVSWTPIGKPETPFKGTYDGKLLDISNLTYTGTDYSGLFGCTDSAVLNGIVLSGVTINGNNHVGALVGMAKNTAIIGYLPYVSNVTVSGTKYVGGIVGTAMDTKIDTVAIGGNVTGEEDIGGIVGQTETTEIRNSSNSAVVTGKTAVGGVVGNAISGTIENTYNVGAVGSDEAINVGGIAGLNSVLIENCYNAGGITGSSAVGEIAGTSNVVVQNNFYVSGKTAVGIGSGDNNTAFTAIEIDKLAEGLREWLANRNESGYYSWYVEEGIEYPIFGAEYSPWLYNIEVNNSSVSFTYNDIYEDNSILYVAMYNNAGNLLNVKIITETNSYTLPTYEGTETVKMFLWDENMMPLENCVSRSVE